MVEEVNFYRQGLRVNLVNTVSPFRVFCIQKYNCPKRFQKGTQRKSSSYEVSQFLKVRIGLPDELLFIYPSGFASPRLTVRLFTLWQVSWGRQRYLRHYSLRIKSVWRGINSLCTAMASCFPGLFCQNSILHLYSSSPSLVKTTHQDFSLVLFGKAVRCTLLVSLPEGTFLSSFSLDPWSRESVMR